MVRLWFRFLCGIAIGIAVGCTPSNKQGAAGSAVITPPESAGGSGEGFAGGDVAWLAMANALSNDIAALRLIEKKHDFQTICEPTPCIDRGDSVVCPTLTNLKMNAAKFAYAKNLLLDSKVVGELIAQALITKIVIRAAVEVDGGQVTAKTTLGPGGGPVEVTRADALAMTSMQREMIMGHEVGHHLNYPGAKDLIQDEKAIGPFPTGREFLNTVGACVASYFASHNIIVMEHSELLIPAAARVNSNFGAASSSSYFQGTLHGNAPSAEGSVAQPFILY